HVLVLVTVESVIRQLDVAVGPTFLFELSVRELEIWIATHYDVVPSPLSQLGKDIEHELHTVGIVAARRRDPIGEEQDALSLRLGFPFRAEKRTFFISGSSNVSAEEYP